jgi:hypothetical protein
MFRKQRGVTFIGWLFLLAPLAVLVYVGIRLTPVYLTYFSVARTLNQTASEMKGDSDAMTVQSIRTSIEKRFDIESVTEPTAKDIIIRRDGKVWVLEAQYQGVAPLFADISLVVDFDKVVEIQ